MDLDLCTVWYHILCIYFCNLLSPLTLYMKYLHVDVCTAVPSVLLYGVQELYYSSSILCWWKFGLFPCFAIKQCCCDHMVCILYLEVELLVQGVCACWTSPHVARSFSRAVVQISAPDSTVRGSPLLHVLARPCCFQTSEYLLI